VTPMSKDIVFMFPGQSSRYPEMFERVLTLSARVNDPILDEAAEILGSDPRADYLADAPDLFSTNQSVQVGVFLTSHLHLAQLRAEGVVAQASLGLSLGEYNHLVEIGVLSFGDALRLVQARGAAYDLGPRGAMAAVSPIGVDDLRDVVTRASSHGSLEITVYNSPTRHVLGGERAAVDAALALLEDEYFVLGKLIEHDVPMHSSLFTEVAARFRPTLVAVPWRAGQGAYRPNADARSIVRPTAAELVDCLTRHVYQPVRWRESLELVCRTSPRARLVEVGPGSVLYNQVGLDWLPPHSRHRTDRGEDLPAWFGPLAEELSRD